MIHGFIIGQVEDRALMARFVPGIEKPKLIPIDSVSILKAAVRADRIQCLQFADEIANFLNT